MKDLQFLSSFFVELLSQKTDMTTAVLPISSATEPWFRMSPPTLQVYMSQIVFNIMPNELCFNLCLRQH